MTKYLFLYRSTLPAADQMAPSADQMQKDIQAGMEPWMNWFKDCGEAILDGGAPLMPGVAMDKDGNTVASTGVTGYSIVQAETMADMKKMLNNHPHYQQAPGAVIEVLEMAPVAM